MAEAPNEELGGEASSSPDDLSGELLDEQFTSREFEMFNNLLFGPADHSALANGVGGPNPTNTGQALAARTAEKIVDRHF